MVACATGTGSTDVGEGGILQDAARDVNVVPNKDSSPPNDTGVPPEEDSGGGCTQSVVINEVKTDGTTANDELIELYNPSSCAVPLGDWELKYQSSGGGAGAAGYKFLVGDSIPAKSYLVLTPGSTATPLKTGMAADKGQIGLLDDTGKVVDAVAYGVVTAGDYREKQSAPAPPSGGTVGRNANSDDTDDNKADFKTFTTPSAGVAN